VPTERSGIGPGDDPYEFEWPDDAQEERAAEREREASRALVRPAPRYLTAIVLGVTTVLVFILPVALVAGAVGFFIAAAAPVVVGGLILAFLPAALLERVSRGWRRGLPELAFLVLGFAIGAGWTWVFVTAFASGLFPDPAQMPAVRAPASVFMGTAVASAFFAARTFTDGARRAPKAVYATGGLVVLLTLLSLYANFAFRPA